MSIIQDYWSGVLQRIQAEVNVFNRLVAHQGERGRENEQAIARVLEGLVPRRFEVSTGLLFNGSGSYSRQLDIIIVDQIDSPAILAQTTQLLFPFEEALASIEVKTTLNKAEIKDAVKKKSSIRELDPDQLRRDESLFSLFAYNAETSPQTIQSNLAELGAEDRPDLACVLDPGIIAGQREILRSPDTTEDYVSGICLLLDRETGEPVRAQHGVVGSHEQRNGTLYPVAEVDGVRYLTDPSRALLLFCEALVRYLAIRDGRNEPVMSSYLNNQYRRLH